MTENLDVKAFVERWLAENGYRQQYHLAIGSSEKEAEDGEEGEDDGK